VLTVFRSLWLEPRPPLPAGALRFGIAPVDAVLVALMVPLAIVEACTRDVPGLPFTFVVAVFVVLALLWRRAQPMAMFCAAFGLLLVENIVAAVVGVRFDGFFVDGVVLLLPYSLFRWGAGRDALLGLAVLAVVYASSMLTGELGDVGDRIGAAVVLLVPGLVGLVVRLQDQAQRRALEVVRVHERERLARDLHDTVGHHLAAIAIQAQAGRFVIATRTEAAAGALAAIEAEASAALRELRGLVGLLRDTDVTRSPTPGLNDVQGLARALPDGRVVVVDIGVDHANMSPVVAAAVFRIAQEGVTNALRHARHAARVVVTVGTDADTDADTDMVSVSVADDGDAVAARRSSSGFGLAGMTERAALLGGTCQAGPHADGGWRVTARLPRQERPR
jgi:signal transduction histidine kinase